MKKFEYVIQDSLGIHARPAGLLVKQAATFQSKIQITLNGKTADAKKIFALMGLSVKCGNTIEVSADGPDEDEAIQALENFLSTNL